MYIQLVQMFKCQGPSGQWFSLSEDFKNEKERAMNGLFSMRCFYQGSSRSTPPSFWEAPISLMSHLFVSGKTLSPSFTRTKGSTCCDTQQGQLTLVQPGPTVVPPNLVRTFSAGGPSTCCWSVSLFLLLPKPSSSPPALLIVRLWGTKSKTIKVCPPPSTWRSLCTLCTVIFTFINNNRWLPYKISN